MVDSSFAIRVVGNRRDTLMACGPSEPLLRAAERAGAEISVGCRQGGCGVCRIQVLSGRYTTLPMSAKHVPHDQRATGYALACKTLPLSDMIISALDTSDRRIKGKAGKKWQ